MRNPLFLPLCLGLFLLSLLVPAHGFALPVEMDEKDADKVGYTPVPFVYPLQSRVRTNHQSPDRVIDECRAQLKKDGALELFFPPQFPGYYVSVTITVKDGRYTATADGAPFAPNGGTSYRVLRQELTLQWDAFKPGEKLEGYCDIDFVETVRQLGGGVEEEYYFSWQGPFVAVIREEGFDPLAEASVKTYDIFLAHYELGPSLQAVSLPLDPKELDPRLRENLPLGGQIGSVRDAGKLAALRRDFWQAHPELNGKPVLEVTWDISPGAGLSDDGRDRLSIWFEREGDKWTQRHFAKWIDAELAFSDEEQGAAANKP